MEIWVRTPSLTSVIVVYSRIGVVWIFQTRRFWRFYFSVYSLVTLARLRTKQKLETVFDRISKQLEFRQKYSSARHISNSLLGVWLDEALFLVFDTTVSREVVLQSENGYATMSKVIMGNDGFTFAWLNLEVFQRGGRKQHKHVYSCFLLPCR